MKILLYTILFSVCIFSVFPLSAQQKYGYNWYFSIEAGMTFNPNNSPSALLDAVQLVGTSDFEGFAFPVSMSDKNGNLLFYNTLADGYYNRSHKIMRRYTELLEGDSSSNFVGALTIPVPGSDHLYYLLHGNYPSNKIYYYVIDMNLNGGLGDFVSTKGKLLAINASGNMAATIHSNGKDFWLVIPNLSNKIHSFRITRNGIDTIPIVSYDSNFPANVYETIIPKFSSRGNKMTLNYYCYTFGGQLNVLDFNKNTGTFLSSQKIFDEYVGETAFSIDESFLYFGRSINGSYPIHQYDFANNILTLVSSDCWGGIQMGPNGKIYYTTLKETSIGEITYPSLPGLACQPNDSAFYLGGRHGLGYFPYQVESFMQPPDMEVFNTCLGSNTHFWFTDTTVIQSVVWSFGDSHSSTDVEAYHVYAAQGTYTAACSILTKAGFTENYTKQVTINAPVQNLSIVEEKSDPCNGSTVWYKTQKNAGSIYRWGIYQNGGAVVAGQNTDSITVKWNVENSKDSLWVFEFNAGGCQGDTARLVVETVNIFTVNIVGDVTLCTPNTGSDLTINIIGTFPCQLMCFVDGIKEYKTINSSQYIIPANSLTKTKVYQLKEIKNATNTCKTNLTGKATITVEEFNTLKMSHD